MIKTGTEPCRGGMTVIAFIRGLDMCGGFTGRRVAVVAAAAGLGNVAMIKECSTPGVGVVASVALAIGCRVRGWFTCGDKAIMTG